MNKSELFEVMGLGPVWTLRKGAAASSAPPESATESEASGCQWWLVSEGLGEGTESNSLSDLGQKLIHDIRRAIEGLTACAPVCTNRLQNVGSSATDVVIHLGDSAAVEAGSSGLRVIGNVTIDELLENPLKKRTLWAQMAASLN